MKILILGSRGFIGRNIKLGLEKKAELICPTSNDLDIRDRESVNLFFKNNYFDFIINCAVYGGRRTKKDNSDTLFFNILMFFNILNNRKSFDKLINFGSGAEFDRNTKIDEDSNNLVDSYPEDFYGMSKNIISRIIKSDNNFYNLRLFGVFGIDEENDRFIKSSIFNSINNENIQIQNNRIFDFFYIKDLIQIIESIILNKNHSFPLEIDLVYKEKVSLKQIAEYIVLKTKSKIQIKGNLNLDKSYSGKYSNFLENFNLIGLKSGINEVIESF